MGSRTETRDHVITRSHDPSVAECLTGNDFTAGSRETTRVEDKHTHEVGRGSARSQDEADRRAWDDLRSKNESR